MAKAVVWILVDHSSRATAFSSIAETLSENDVESEIVTITEVLGNAAKGAISGSAERLIRGLRVAFKGRSDEDFIGAVQKGQPDLIVVTNQRYVRALSLLKSVTGSHALQVGVCTDYNFSEAWSRSLVQAFIVPHEDFKTSASRSGVLGSRVVVAGPPIQASFENELDREKVREKFKFSGEKVVLVRANGFDPSTLDKLLFQSTLVDSKCRYLFHHDDDGTTASTLRVAASKYGVPALMFGKVGDLERFVVAADVVVCAPQEPYISEIIALDKPVVFVGNDDEKGQQVEFLTTCDAAGQISDVLRFGGAFDPFLTDDWLLTASKAGAALSNQKANIGVAEALLSILQESKSWTQSDNPPGDTPSHDPNSPFEEIGGEDEAETNNESFVGISKAEAKEQLASLILAEREIERKLADIEAQQERWRKRLQMARDMDEEDLATDAESVLREYIDEGSSIQAELKSVLGQKNKLKIHAGAGAARTLGPKSTSHEKVEEMERRFRKMEVDSDLDDLKNKIKRELGE